MDPIKKLARQCILERKDYVPGKPVEEVKRELGLDDVIKLASNENPLGTSPLALEAMLNELRENAGQYPESLCFDLVQKLSAIHELHASHFFVDNGLDGVITKIGMTFINPGDEVISGSLSFPAYENIVSKMDGKNVFVPNRADFSLDTDRIIRAINKKTKLIFIANPNNPTGTVMPKEEFDAILKAVPETALLISDEAYYDFCDDSSYPQTIPYLSKHWNLMVLRTFSKIMGLAGLRIGYAMAHPDVVKLMLKAREPFPVNRIAQAGALAALDDDEFIRKTKKINAEGREQLAAGFESFGFRVIRGQANFIFIDLGRPAFPLFEGMLQEGVIIRPLGANGAPNAMRVSIGTHEQNARALEAFKRVLDRS